MDITKCPDCGEYWVMCPCCNTWFCPDCQQLEESIDWDELEE